MRKCAAVKGDMAGCYHQKHASDDCKATISNMSEISLLNIMHETGNYLIREGSQKIETKTWILYGEKEKRECIKNTSRLKNKSGIAGWSKFRVIIMGNWRLEIVKNI